MDTTNYIVRLYEFAQSKSWLLEFEDVDAVGPDNMKIFTVRAVLNGKAYANGVGRNKKEAKQIAAKNALESVRDDPPPESTDAAPPSVPPSPVQPAVMTHRNYKSWLYEYGQKNNVSISFVESTNLEPTNAPQCCKFIVGDKEYPAAFGTTKKEAKEEAAKLVYCEMFGSEVSPAVDGISVQRNKDDNRASGVAEVIFTVRAVLNGKAHANGMGKKKQEAKQIAAKKALESVHDDPPPESTDAAPPSVPPSPVQPAVMTHCNYKSWLNNYGQKSNVSISFVESTNLEPTNAPQCCKFIVGGKEYPAAFGTTKKEAKEEAAKLVYCEMFGSEASQAVDGISVQRNKDDNQASGVAEVITSIPTEDERFAATDFIGKLRYYCLTKNLHPEIVLDKRTGPSHNPQFVYKVVINKKDYPLAEGKNIKEAKQKAAQMALFLLVEQSDWDSKVSVESAMFQDNESEISSAASNLLESEFSDQSAQSSSGSSWIQFKDSEPSPVQGNSSAKDSGLEKNIKNTLTKTSSRFTSEYDGDVELLGNGSYGCVYKAKKLRLNVYCAIKEIQTKDENESLREVKVLWGLLHPNIVRYYTCWFQDTGFRCSKGRSNAKFLFIEMELCDGGTLKRWIQNKNTEPQENSRQKESLEFAGQILSGVKYIHGKKLIHRDLKPENILFGGDGKVRIGDFGLATKDDDEDEVVERTEDRGTRSYMAPEQFGVNYDRKVDIFALGLIFFELFWRISTRHEKLEIWKHVRGQNFPKEFTGTYPIESRIIKTMLSIKPEDRPEACAVKSELEKWTQTSEEDIDQKTI